MLIDHFGTLPAVLAAPCPDIDRVTERRFGVGAHLTTIQEALTWTLRERLETRPLFASDVAVMDYLRLAQGHSKIELVRVLYLDSANRLLRDEVVSEGTIDTAAIYVREIIVRALDVGAVGIILAHNHPSGDAMPSDADRDVTKTLELAGRPLGIRLLDHILVTAGEAVSFRALGYI